MIWFLILCIVYENDFMKLEFCHVGEAALARPDQNDIWFALLWILQNISQQQKGNDFTNLSYCCTMRRPVFDYIIWILHLKRVWLVELVVKWLWRSGWKAGHPRPRRNGTRGWRTQWDQRMPRGRWAPWRGVPTSTWSLGRRREQVRSGPGAKGWPGAAQCKCGASARGVQSWSVGGPWETRLSLWWASSVQAGPRNWRRTRTKRKRQTPWSLYGCLVSQRRLWWGNCHEQRERDNVLLWNIGIKMRMYKSHQTPLYCVVTLDKNTSDINT